MSSALYTQYFMKAHKHLDAGVTLLRETDPVSANEIASYVNKIYTLLVDVQDDLEPVFTGNDLIAYDTPKGLARSGGLPSLEMMAKARGSGGGMGLGQRSYIDVSDLEEQRPRFLRLFNFDTPAPPPATFSNEFFEVDQSSDPPSPPRAPTAIRAARTNPAVPIIPALPMVTGGPRTALRPPPSLPALDPGAAQMRVVWVCRCPLHAKLADIAGLIREGPVHSISFRTDPRTTLAREARIVFHLAADAARFLERVGASEENTWLRDLHFEFGQHYPDDEEMSLMSPPINARRRLTVVRSGLFSHPGAKTSFNNDIYNNVRRASVELVFFYNSGNATIVLDSVNKAIRLKTWFDNKAATLGSPYEGVKVTFSKDPCEHNMRLVSSTSHERQLRSQQRVETKSGRRR